MPFCVNTQQSWPLSYKRQLLKNVLSERSWHQCFLHFSVHEREVLSHETRTWQVAILVLDENFPPLASPSSVPLWEPLVSLWPDWRSRAQPQSPPTWRSGQATQQGPELGLQRSFIEPTRFAFVLFLHLHPTGRGLRSNAPEGVWVYDPKVPGLTSVRSESERSSALPVGTRQQKGVPWLTCPIGIRTLSHTHTWAGTPVLCTVICYPLLGLRWAPCCFYTAKLRGSTVNGQIALHANVAKPTLWIFSYP